MLENLQACFINQLMYDFIIAQSFYILILLNSLSIKFWCNKAVVKETYSSVPNRHAGQNKRAGGKFRWPDICKFQKRANSCLQKCPKQNTSLRNNYVNFLGHLSSNWFQLKGRFGTHEILNIPIPINVQDRINVQGGIFHQNQ